MPDPRGTTQAIPVESWTALVLMTLVYVVNTADRLIISTVLQPIKLEFQLSDAAMGFLTGGPVAVFYVAACIPLGRLADRTNRRNMIAIVLAAWSVFTIGCGRAGGVFTFILCRLGVGLGEAGASPTCISLLADRFPTTRRPMAMTIFSLGIPLGAAIVTAFGGWASDRFGWRTTLTAFGAIGIPIAVVILLMVREPRRGAMDPGSTPPEEVRFGPTLRFMNSQRSLRHVIAGAAVLSVWATGLFWWMPAFLVRSHHLSVGEAGGVLAPIHAFGGGAMTLATAFLMRRLGRVAPRWQARFVAAMALIGVSPSIACFLVPQLWQCKVLLWIYIPIAYCYIGPTVALVQSLVPATMRALASALLLFAASLMSYAAAPQIIGFASDVVARHLADPQQSLRWVLAVGALAALWSALHYLAAARALAGDLARATAFAAPAPAPESR
jgi:MFS family permease